MYKVYIVDDEAAVVKGLSNAIDWESYNIEIAGTSTDPAEAVRVLSQTQVDILITDVRMPVYDGLTLMKLAKKSNPMLRSIVVSAYDCFDYVKEALKSGAENYLLKPVDQNELQDTLRKTLENIESEHMAHMDAGYSMMAFRSNILERWVRNTITEAELMERVEMIGIDLQSDSFTVLYLYNNSTARNIHSAMKLLNIAVSLTGQDFTGHYFINHAFHVVGILFGCNETKMSIHTFLEKLLRLSLKEGLDVFPVLGPTVSEVSKVGKSYSLAEKYTSARFLDLPSLFCSNFPEVYRPSEGWHEKMALLNEALNNRAPGNAVEIAKSIMDCSKGSLSADEQKLAALSIAVNIHNAIQSSHHTQKTPDSFICLFKKLRSASTGELMELITRLIMLAAQILSDKQDLLHPYVRKSIEFIRSEANQEISLKTMAAKFNVSPAYLGQMFKLQTGKYFNDYLTSIRLEWSKKLISETDMKVSDIARKVGFSSQTYFNRTFKQAYGTSPGEYRYAAKTS